jgi:ureidoacrylate peracid hydrolase
LSAHPDIPATVAAKVAPNRTALVVIDMSNDLVDPNGKTAIRSGRPVEHARRIIPSLVLLVEAARRSGVPVFFIAHTTLPDGASDSGPWLDARRRATFSVLDLCVDGTWGQEIIAELALQPGDVMVKKYRYSSFVGTELDLMLRARGRDSIICTGVSTNVCVEATARDAFGRDYYVVIPSDGVASWDPDLHRATLASAGHRYASITTVDEIMSAWAAARTDG